MDNSQLNLLEDFTVKTKSKAFLFCWGKNDAGELSLANTKNTLLPKESKGYFGKPIQISSAKNHSALVNSNGAAYVTGSTLLGKLGLQTNFQNYIVKFQKIPDLIVRQVACGDYHTVVLLDDRRVFAWGGNLHGKLGQRCGRPSQVSGLPRDIRFVDCGDFHTIALTQGGELYSWGGGGPHKNKGQLGHGKSSDGSLSDLQNPKAIQFFRRNPIRLAKCGGYHTLAVTQSEQIYGWGQGQFGQCGFGQYDNTPTPKKIVLSCRSPSFEQYQGMYPGKLMVQQIQLGGHHSLIITTNGLLFSFGYGSHGQLGHGHSDNQCQPCLVNSLLGKKVVQIAAGWFHSVVLSSNKDIYTCGYGKKGQLGVGDQKTRSSFIHVKEMSGKNVSKIFAGGDCTWAVLDQHQPQQIYYEPPSPLRVRADDSKSVIQQSKIQKSMISHVSRYNPFANQTSLIDNFAYSDPLNSERLLEVLFTDVIQMHRLVNLVFKQPISEYQRQLVEDYVQLCKKSDKIIINKVQFLLQVFNSTGKQINEADYKNTATLMMIVQPELRVWPEKEIFQVDRKKLQSKSVGFLMKLKTTDIAKNSWQNLNSRWFFRLLQRFDALCTKIKVVQLRPKTLLN